LDVRNTIRLGLLTRFRMPLAIAVLVIATFARGVAMADQQKQAQEPQRVTAPSPPMNSSSVSLAEPAAGTGNAPQVAGDKPVKAELTVKLDDDRGQSSGVSGWFRFVLGLLFPWPALVATVLGYLLFGRSAPSRIRALLRPFQSVKLFGQEFVLNREGGQNVENGNLVLSRGNPVQA
jgi:hypothetical protein